MQLYICFKCVICIFRFLDYFVIFIFIPKRMFIINLGLLSCSLASSTLVNFRENCNENAEVTFIDSRHLVRENVTQNYELIPELMTLLVIRQQTGSLFTN